MHLPSRQQSPEVALPRVSVLMAVCNTVEYVQDALRSISGQSFSDFELIVIDDGSSDGSTEVLKSYAAREPRMKLVTRQNVGLISTRNELLSRANGELIAWMDSDDVALPSRLARQVMEFDSKPDLVCLGTAAQCINPQGRHLNVEKYPTSHQEILREQALGSGFRFPTTMMRRQTAQNIGGFREPFKMGEDFDFLLRLGEKGQLGNLSDALYLYRQHITSVCAMLGPRWHAYREEILKLAAERKETGRDRLQNGETITINAPDKTNKAQIIAEVYVSWVRRALAIGDIPLAWSHALDAIRAEPMRLANWKVALRVIRAKF